MRMSLFIGLSTHILQERHVRTSPNFLCMLPVAWFAPDLAALQYVMCIRFCGWHHVFHNGHYGAGDASQLQALKWLIREQHEFYIVALPLTDSSQVSMCDKGQSLMSKMALFFSAIRMTVFRLTLNLQRVFTASFDRCRRKNVTFYILRLKWQGSVTVSSAVYFFLSVDWCVF